MNKSIIAVALVISGIGAGGLGAYAVTQHLFPDLKVNIVGLETRKVKDLAPTEREVMELGPVTLPVSDMGGKFIGYIEVGAKLVVPKAMVLEMTQRNAQVLDLVNKRAWKTPIAIDEDKRTIDVDALRRLFQTASDEVYVDKGVQVSITSVMPV